MKKIPLSVKIIVPLMVVFLACGVFFGIKFSGTDKLLNEKNLEVESIESATPNKHAADYAEKKHFYEYASREYESIISFYEYSENEATYEHKNIEFISFSKEWDEDDLEDLCDELFENKHGEEINELDLVIVYDNYYSDYPPVVVPDYDQIDIPVSLFEMLPFDFIYSYLYEKNTLHIYAGDDNTEVEQLAYNISHSYGYFFTSYYFDLYGEDEVIENDPYFELRYDKDYDFVYSYDAFEEWDDYVEDYIWYLLEIAADDYVYLMGSPNAKRTLEYIDTQDQLRLDIKDKEDELDDYFDLTLEYSFNEMPHLNLVIPLPDQVKDLPELFYDTIDEKTPDYTDRSKEAEDIELTVKKSSSHGKRFYSATWDKPWKDEDVLYTLAAYDKDDLILGGIKTIDGTKRARAIFGGAVLDSSSTSYTWYDEDYWSKQGFVRLRVIVTFSDGTAVVSPPVDWSFE